MNTQIHVRVSKELLNQAKEFSELKGYSSEQEYFRTALREKIEEDRKKEAIEGLWKLKGSVPNAKPLTRKERDKIARSL